MKTSSILRITLLIWAVFTAIDFIAGIVLPTKQADGSHFLVWSLGANFIVAITLALLASRTLWCGRQLALALSAVPLAITVINDIEGVVYLDLPGSTITFHMIKYALILPLWLVMFPQPTDLPSSGPTLSQRTFSGKLWRFVFCNFSYLILYLTAGILIFPLVRDFYATQPMPSFGQIVSLQLLVRGPVFVGICVLLSGMINLQLLSRVIAVGLAFALISGVAPLIVPNTVFPDAVRWVHFYEVTSSNFVFGVLVALIWSKKPSVLQPMTPTT